MRNTTGKTRGVCAWVKEGTDTVLDELCRIVPAEPKRMHRQVHLHPPASASLHARTEQLYTLPTHHDLPRCDPHSSTADLPHDHLPASLTSFARR